MWNLFPREMLSHSPEKRARPAWCVHIVQPDDNHLLLQHHVVYFKYSASGSWENFRSRYSNPGSPRSSFPTSTKEWTANDIYINFFRIDSNNSWTKCVRTMNKFIVIAIWGGWFKMELNNRFFTVHFHSLVGSSTGIEENGIHD